jgi:hypothetical protein
MLSFATLQVKLLRGTLFFPPETLFLGTRFLVVSDKLRSEHRIHSVRRAFLYGGIQRSEAECLRGGRAPSLGKIEHRIYSARNAYFVGGIQRSEAKCLRGGRAPSLGLFWWRRRESNHANVAQYFAP